MSTKKRAGTSARPRSQPRPSARRPLPQGRNLYTPDASARRRAFERRSAAPVVFLHQLPRWVPPVVLAVLLITGLSVHGIGGALALLGVAVVLSWLALLSWPRLSLGGRATRTAVIALVTAAAVVQVIRR
ncbi:MAG: DUF6703 family protein [Streptosporangiaceae bacterium]